MQTKPAFSSRFFGQSSWPLSPLSHPRRANGPQFGSRDKCSPPIADNFTPASLPGFRPEHVQGIRALMRRYRYGKDLNRMLQPESRMNVFYHQGQLILRNYHFPPIPKGQTEQKGICGELSQACITQLRQQWGEHYEFALVSGTEPRYFSNRGATHVFILGWPAKQDSDVRRQLKECRFLIPREAVVIDPSFGQILGHPEAARYQINQVISGSYGSDGANPDAYDTYTSLRLETLSGQPEPLGFLRDLDPHAKAPGNPLVYILFCHDKEGKPAFRLLYQEPERPDITQWKSWHEDIHPESPLARFAAKLEAELQTPLHPRLRQKLEDQMSASLDLAWLPRTVSEEELSFAG